MVFAKHPGKTTKFIGKYKGIWIKMEEYGLLVYIYISKYHYINI